MHHPSPARFVRSVIASIAFAVAASAAHAQAPLPGEPAGRGTYQEFQALFAEFIDWRTPEPGADGLVDYGPKAVAERRKEMKRLQARLADMNVAAWPRAQKVDYLVARAHFDETDFILNVTQPWKRDPHFYADPLMQIAFTNLPVEGAALEKLKADLASVPAVVAAAKRNLDGVIGDNADFALFNLSNSDGVNHMHPYRATPPAGTIGWYEDLLARADAQPELKPAIAAALEAVKSYRDWLTENRAQFTALNGVGEKHLDWYIKHVKMLPYTSDEVLELAEMERDRLYTYLEIERHKNRDLPEIALPKSREEYEARVAATDKRVRDFLVREEFITIPDFVPEDWREVGFNVPWIVRDTPPNFWEQVQYRDPMPDHLHAVIPGHRFDGMIEKNMNHPIRKYSFGDRREGWGVYLEEAAMQAGIIDDLPRVRELIYLFGHWRAVRTMGDVLNQTNVLTHPETVDYWMSWTPMLDRGVALKYSYLRATPATTLHYTMGTLQMRKLFAERKHQLGDKFVLKDFHDEFMSFGRIPVALIRYEMTGADEDVREFWRRTPLSELGN